MSEAGRPSAGHETRDVRVGPVVLAGLGLLALLVVLGPLEALLLRHYTRREARIDAATSPLAAREVPPAPRLQVDPRADLRALRAEEDALLGTYGWLDRQAGSVRLPIERAMALLVERRRREGGR